MTTTGLTDGFHLMVDALKANDVDTIYGIVGIPITDLARVAQASGIRYIGFRQETSAGNAAAAAGYLTKRPGICLTTSGPGFLNGLPALANATTNCFPMIQISGSSSRAIVDLQRGDYQDLDQLSAARPFVKAAYRISRAEDIGRGVARAIRTAISTGRAASTSTSPVMFWGSPWKPRPPPTRSGASLTRLRGNCPRRRPWIARSGCWPRRSDHWSCSARVRRMRRPTT